MRWASEIPKILQEWSIYVNLIQLEETPMLTNVKFSLAATAKLKAGPGHKAMQYFMFPQFFVWTEFNPTHLLYSSNKQVMI